MTTSATLTSETGDTMTTSLQTISDAGAQRVMTTGVEMATREVCPAVVAVVDINGTLKALLRMDGSPHIGADLARRKAYTAVALGGADLAKVAERMKDNPALAAALSSVPEMSILPGGVPIMVGGTLVGAVGVSSTNSALDHTIAVAAAGALAD